MDLAHWNLPLFDEPGVPARDAPVREHTKAWQAKVRTLDGFVFVTPQVGHKHDHFLVEADRSASTKHLHHTSGNALLPQRLTCCFLCETAVWVILLFALW